MNNEHVKFAATLGFLTARAKATAENPELAEKQGWWASIPKELQALLFGLDPRYQTIIK